MMFTLFHKIELEAQKQTIVRSTSWLNDKTHSTRLHFYIFFSYYNTVCAETVCAQHLFISDPALHSEIWFKWHAQHHTGIGGRGLDMVSLRRECFHCENFCFPLHSASLTTKFLASAPKKDKLFYTTVAMLWLTHRLVHLVQWESVLSHCVWREIESN